MKNRIKKYLLKAVAVFTAAVILILCTGCSVIDTALEIADEIGLTGDESTEAYNSSNEEYMLITVPSGTSAAGIGQLLEENGIIGDAEAFRRYSKKQGFDTKFQAGDYYLSPSLSMEEICDVLCNGKIAVKTFTIPEGLNADQTAKKLADQGMGDFDEFIKCMYGDDFGYGWIPEEVDLINCRLEGYLLPNTYVVPMGYDEWDIVNYLLSQFEQTAISLIDDNENEVTKDLNINEIMTIASIIERECKVDDERAKVSSVIQNRLEKGMKLQVDCTLQYIFLKETGEVKEVVLYSDLEIDNPYNTYMYEGLPPAPICSPGIASIKAALNPEDTDYLYYVLSEKLDGTSNFSSDYNKFLKDKSAYDAAYTKAHS